MRPRQPSNPGKRVLPGRIGGAFSGAPPIRAGAEAVALAGALCLALVFPSGLQSAFDPVLQVLVVGPLSAMLAAARTRLGGGGWRANLPREGAWGVALVAVVTAVGMAAVAATGFVPEYDIVVTVFGVLLWNSGAFACFRTLAYLWPRWVGLRRSRLRWEMTHTTLTVVAAVSSVVIVVAVIYSLLVADNPSALTQQDPSGTLLMQSRLAVILPLVGILVFLTVVALGVILPPAALVSYFAARRTARRLESLARGTSGLREGNLAIRVEVDGADEVSDLQKDFNAMAGDLERAMRDLRSERDYVERLLKAQRELVASVSHELRTPVATMRGYLESALDADGGNGERRLPGDVRDDLEVVGREAVRLQRLIDDLFVLSRTETGNLPLEIHPTDVTALLSRCAGAVSGGAWRGGRVEVIHTVEEDPPPVLADEGRLEQVVRNLLQNAVRHTPPGGIVGLSAAADPGAVTIEVKDTGGGIAPGELERIFERFYRSDGARELDHAGAGLGLTLVRELTEAMNGSVSAESEPGSGSRFTLRLPRA